MCPQSSTPPRGLQKPTTFPVPDELVDVWATRLNGAEIKIMLYICRRTLGFRKDNDAISYKQFTDGITTRDGRQLDQGAGVARSSLRPALKHLEELGLLTVERTMTALGDAGVTYYGINWAETSPTGVGQKLAYVVRNPTGGGPKIGLPVGQKLDTQETVVQETVTTENPSRDLAARLGDRIAVALRQPTPGTGWARTLRSRGLSDAALERLVTRALAAWEVEHDMEALTETLEG